MKNQSEMQQKKIKYSNSAKIVWKSNCHRSVLLCYHYIGHSLHSCTHYASISAFSQKSEHCHERLNDCLTICAWTELYVLEKNWKEQCGKLWCPADENHDRFPANVGRRLMRISEDSLQRREKRM